MEVAIANRVVIADDRFLFNMNPFAEAAIHSRKLNGIAASESIYRFRFFKSNI